MQVFNGCFLAVSAANKHPVKAAKLKVQLGPRVSTGTGSKFDGTVV